MAAQIANEFNVIRPSDDEWPIICEAERLAPGPHGDHR